MVNNNFIIQSFKILGELGRDLLYFPVWWYSMGLWETIKRLLNFVYNRQKALALLVWIKNIHRPMYGQYDWQGRLISFAVRFVQIIARSIILLFWTLIALAVLLVWLALPPFIIFQIIIQFL